MSKTFNPAEFVQDVGDELVASFNRARKATTPTLIGDAMEAPIRDRLVQILPKGIGVGSGCVIDTFGGTSRQMDIILYEKEQCSVFCINESPATTYYPCEGVLAVGEVKSRIGKKELADGFRKIRSVKSLRRTFENAPSGEYVGRPYGDHGSSAAYSFDLHNTNLGDIFGFIVAEEPGVQIVPSNLDKRVQSILDYYIENVKALGNDVLCPEMVVFLNGNILAPVTINTESKLSASYVPARSNPVLPHGILPKESESPFAEIIQAIWHRHQEGLTAHLPLNKYLKHDTQTEPRCGWTAFVHVEPVNQDPGSGIKTPTDHLSYQRDHYIKSQLPK